MKLFRLAAVVCFGLAVCSCAAQRQAGPSTGQGPEAPSGTLCGLYMTLKVGPDNTEIASDNTLCNGQSIAAENGGGIDAAGGSPITCPSGYTPNGSVARSVEAPVIFSYQVATCAKN